MDDNAELNGSSVRRERILGCMLGGAVGDALGAPVEFLSLKEIRQRFGPAGIRDYAPAYGRLGAITDDTQMSLFTAEGLIRAWVRLSIKGIANPTLVVRHAYWRWLITQGEEPPEAADSIGRDGWLIGVTDLWSRRAPGETCISGLQQLTDDLRADNDSKGCDGVMRMAPVGLVAADSSTAFRLGCEMAQLTHGHPSGYLSAGFLAALIRLIVEGLPLAKAVPRAVGFLTHSDASHEVLSAATAAVELALNGAPSAKKVESLGRGWVAEEALSIGLYSALVAGTFEEAVVLAVNHSGDSDSTGAIAGNIAGALLGAGAIPSRWLDELELRHEISSLAQDMWRAAVGDLDPESRETWTRYPGW